MICQIFRRPIPIELLMELLEKICLKTDKYFLIDSNAYKVLLYNKYQEDFLNAIIDYYHASKAYYVTREFTYKSFTNIVRQICKSRAIMYSSMMKYDKSKYNIDYFVYFPQTK
jgi:hypothetical protein